MTSEALMVGAIALPALLAAGLWCLPVRWVSPTAIAGGAGTALLTLAVATAGLAQAGGSMVTGWLALDAISALVVGVIGLVGLVAMLISPGHLATLAGSGPAGQRRRVATYYSMMFAFWATLLAVPLAGNLALAVLLAEATTATSAFLVGFGRSAGALEAGWKYLVLTSLGLGTALLGVLLLGARLAHPGPGGLAWRALPTFNGNPSTALVAYLLIIAGLAAKIGWAPVHNWLPDAHSEAPAPLSALLSAGLLPAVIVVAWRVEQGLAPVIGAGVANGVFVVFGLASMGVAVPFVVRSLPWKRLLAYSSLEHMGVIALGIGFGTPLALVGVIVHIAAHAVAKTLGFATAVPLFAHAPEGVRAAVYGVGRSQPRLAGAMALSLGTLSGIPPLPLFASELLILAGGFQSRWPWAAVVAALLLALAFIGLLRSLVETTMGAPTGGPAAEAIGPAGLAGVTALAVVAMVLLLFLTGVALWLPTTDLAHTLQRGVQ